MSDDNVRTASLESANEQLKVDLTTEPSSRLWVIESFYVFRNLNGLLCSWSGEGGVGGEGWE